MILHAVFLKSIDFNRFDIVTVLLYYFFLINVYFNKIDEIGKFYDLDLR